MFFRRLIYQKKVLPGVLFFFCIQHALAKANSLNALFKKNDRIPEVSFPGLQPAAGSPDSSSFIIPFSRAGNLIIIKAKADAEEGNFILDTGCPGLVLNITYFRNYPVITEPDTESSGITGGAAPTEQVMISDFNFGKAGQYNIKANLANLGNIENSKGIKVLGLIGMQLFARSELIIDYQKNLLYFHFISHAESGSYRHAMLKDTAAYYIIPFEITDGRMIVRSVIEGKKLRFIIDCAAETSILDSRLPDKIFESLSVTGKVSLAGVGNKKVDAVTGSLANFSIAGHDIKDLPVLITNLDKSCLSQGGCVDGVLGIDRLSLQKIGFNFNTHKMYIWK